MRVRSDSRQYTNTVHRSHPICTFWLLAIRFSLALNRLHLLLITWMPNTIFSLVPSFSFVHWQNHANKDTRNEITLHLFRHFAHSPIKYHYPWTKFRFYFSVCVFFSFVRPRHDHHLCRESKVWEQMLLECYTIHLFIPDHSPFQAILDAAKSFGPSRHFIFRSSFLLLIYILNASVAFGCACFWLLVGF